MSRRTYQIPLDEASPGMVLADDLLDDSGKILLPAGATLSDASIASLRRREIDMLPIVGEETADVDAAADLERHRLRLQQLFRKHTDDDMATEILRQFVFTFRLGANP
jgi:hypothetical protein